ncbi:MAG: AI-2E family transporter [Myxococcota bacterium]|nr:AI-2E family transporter [Myxococcota bacterium]
MTHALPTATSPASTRVEISPKTIALAVLIPAAAWVLVQLLPVFLVLIASLFLVGTLNPAVAWLGRRGTSRAWSIALVFGAVLLVTLLLMALTVPSLVEQLTTLAKNEPRIRARLADSLGHSQLSAPLAEWLRNARYESLATTLAKTALTYSARAFEIFAYVVSAVFLALYIMVDRDRLRGGLFALVPRTHHIRLSRILLNLEVIVGGYIRGQILTSALMAVFVLVLLALCRVPNALALATFAGVADVLPYIGVLLSVGPAVIAALAKGPVIAGVVLVAMLAYEELESRFLVPRVYGHALRLPSSVVLFALLAGGTLLGIVGALLALPVAAAVRMLIEELRIELPGEQVDDAAIRARDDSAEREYERRTEGIPAEQAAAIAVAMAEKRVNEEGGAEAATAVPISLRG